MSNLSAEQRLKTTEALHTGTVSASIYRHVPNMIELHDIGDTLVVSLEDAVALRDWLNKVLP